MADGSLGTTLDALVALESEVHETLNVYRWWRPDMALPALWNWLTPASTEDPDVPACRVVDTARITATIGVDPSAIAGEGDMLEVEAYADLFRDLLNAEVYSRTPFGQRMARRRGFQTVADRLGDTMLLCIEFPIEVELPRSVQTNP